MGYVDDTFVIQQVKHKQTFLESINKVDPTIRFKAEGNQENGAMPFLDTICTKPDHLINEIQLLRNALTKCKYPKLTLDKVERKFINMTQEDSSVGNNQGELNDDDSNNPHGNNTGRGSTKEKYSKGHIVIHQHKD